MLFGRKQAKPSQYPRIRSLDDLDGHFPWPDIGAPFGSPASDGVRNPLAVAIRAVRVVEYTVATVTELNPDERDASGMALLGFSAALHSLAEHGDWNAVGLLLNAFESMIAPHDRQRWLGGLDPYIEPAAA